MILFIHYSLKIWDQFFFNQEEKSSGNAYVLKKIKKINNWVKSW
jgi:hypothetical protein